MRSMCAGRRTCKTGAGVPANDDLDGGPRRTRWGPPSTRGRPPLVWGRWAGCSNPGRCTAIDAGRCADTQWDLRSGRRKDDVHHIRRPRRDARGGRQPVPGAAAGAGGVVRAALRAQACLGAACGAAEKVNEKEKESSVSAGTRARQSRRYRDGSAVIDARLGVLRMRQHRWKSEAFRSSGHRGPRLGRAARCGDDDAHAHATTAAT